MDSELDQELMSAWSQPDSWAKRYEPPREPVSAVDIAKAWEPAVDNMFFTPEMIEKAGGAKELFETYAKSHYDEKKRLFVMSTPRQMGKSRLAEMYREMMGTKADTIIMDDDVKETEMAGKLKEPKRPALSEEALAHLEHMAAQMTDALAALPKDAKTVSLATPALLTVERKTGYGKHNHVGGEDFTVDRVYIGSPKAGSKMIFCLKPTSAMPYECVEMAQSECESQLMNWRGVVDLAVNGNFYMKLEEVRNIDVVRTLERERERQASEYKEFGAW